MQNQSVNPLAKHFRQPAVYMTLPSGGKYWPDGTLDLPLTGQVAVYPMTTRDEITVRTPDALLSGESVVSIIQSCCPQIKDAWKMPSIDVDATLIAIRIASYGQEMDIDTICPNEECKHENKHGLDLTAVLDGIKAPNYNKHVEVNGLKIRLKPQSYFEGNKSNLIRFEEDRLISVAIDDTMDPDEKRKKYNEHMQKLVSINLDLIVAGTEYVETSEGDQVTNPAFIKEFYDNADTKVIKAVTEKFDEFNDTVALLKPKVQCEECGTDYPVSIQFDYANFFGIAS